MGAAAHDAAHGMAQPQIEWPPTTKLHTEIVNFSQRVALEAAAGHEEAMGIIEALRAMVQRKWSRATVEMFGSRSTGLYLPSSDVDVTVMGTKCEPKDVSAALTYLHDELEKEPWVQRLQLILSARIPVIKLVSQGGIPVDVSIASSPQHTGLLARDLVCSYLAHVPHLLPLVHVFKSLLRQLGLNDPYTGGMSSYCLVVLLYNFIIEAQQFDCGAIMFYFLTTFATRFEMVRPLPPPSPPSPAIDAAAAPRRR